MTMLDVVTLSDIVGEIDLDLLESALHEVVDSLTVIDLGGAAEPRRAFHDRATRCSSWPPTGSAGTGHRAGTRLALRRSGGSPPPTRCWRGAGQSPGPRTGRLSGLWRARSSTSYPPPPPTSSSPPRP